MMAWYEWKDMTPYDDWVVLQAEQSLFIPNPFELLIGYNADVFSLSSYRYCITECFPSEIVKFNQSYLPSVTCRNTNSLESILKGCPP